MTKNKFTYLFIGLFGGFFLANRLGVSFTQGWKIESNTIILEYLKILFSLPTVILIIFVIFSIKFSPAINYFIRNLRMKYGGIEATSQKIKNISPDKPGMPIKKTNKLSKQDAQKIAKNISELESTKKTQQQTITQLQNLVTRLANRSEFFEFKYLSKFLVLNTQQVLKDLVGNTPITKDLLIKKILVARTILDSLAEQTAIYDALLINGLIIKNNSVIDVSEKGHRFLKFIGLT